MPIYSVFGLRLSSEIPLPELYECPADAAAPDATIRIGSVPSLGPDEKTGYTVTPEGTLLNVTDVGRYWIADGREMIAEPAAGGSERNLRLYLLGSALGALLHQRGLLPLHANAIEVDGRAVAFMGHSGAGKSTMAAWFHDRGFRILADDVCVVTFGETGRPVAHAGIPRLRLWREALEASGRAADDFQASFDDMDKYDVPTASRAAPPAPLNLGAVYLLSKAAQDEGGIRRLQGVAAVDALVANTYRGGYVKLAGGGTERHLRACLELVRAVPVFAAERVWGYERFDEQARLLEAHARSAVTAP